MNFTFADVSTSFTNMLKQDVPRDVMGSTGDRGQQKPLFAEKLSQTIEEIESYENNHPLTIESGRADQSQANLTQAGEDLKNIIDDLSEKLEQKKGFGFVSALKNFLMLLSKGDLKNISIDANGLEAFKKILVKAGFKETELDELMAELLDESGSRGLSLDDLLDKLLDSSLETLSEKKPSRENFLGISAIPFIESILNSLGIPKDQVQEIVTKADKGEKGISLEVIIQRLQLLQRKSFFTKDDYKTGEGDENFKKLFASLKLEQPESQSSGLTLEGLLASLEKLRQKLSQDQFLVNEQSQPAGNEKSSDLLANLFKGLEFKNKTPGNQGFGFSHDQISDQFKNELLVPGMGGKSQKDLFLVKKNSKSSGTGPNDVFKEMGSLLGQKKSRAVDMADPLKESEKFIKQLKSKRAKLADSGQLSAGTVKTNDTQSGLNILKAKSNFKNLPAYVTRQVGKSLVRAINQGENVLKIQLKPPELGRLMMTIDHTGDSMKVSIMTENHAAKEILASNINELRTILSNSGVTLERFDVDMNSNFKQSMADAKNQTGNFGNRNRNRGKLDSIKKEGGAEALSLRDALYPGGALHFVA